MPDVRMSLEGAGELVSTLRRWDRDTSARLKSELDLIGEAWKTEAKKRVPVEHGVLRNSINKEVTVSRDDFELAVGTHVKYGVYLEFGTEHIAGGRVKALGDSPDVTDQQAITDWPAKAETNARREQMPWLRTAWHAIKERAIRRIVGVFAITGGSRT